MFFVKNSELRAAERKWRKSKDLSDLSIYQSLLCWSPHCQGFILPQQDQQRIWHTQSLQNIQLSPLSSSTTSLTADDFATFFTNKTSSISSQFSALRMQELKPTTSTDKTPLLSFCPLMEAEVSKPLLSSHPTTCPLDPIPSLLLQAISPTLLPAFTHIINTSLLTSTFPTAFRQAQKTYIKHFTYR